MAKFEVTIVDESIECRILGETEIVFYLHEIDDYLKSVFSCIEDFEQTGKFFCQSGENSSWGLMVDKQKIYFEYGAYTIDIPSSMTVVINTNIGYEFVKEIYAKICETLN
jgi:hypothetical protein